MFTFTKEERLCSRKGIEFLYTNGKGKNIYPLRVIVLKNKLEQKYPVRFIVSVPKKRVRKAVDRNRAKRIIRESWRLHKHELYEELKKKNLYCDVMFLYLSSDLPELKQIEAKIPLVFNFIMGEIGKD
jgi:ribonuclease P protein component